MKTQIKDQRRKDLPHKEKAKTKISTDVPIDELSMLLVPPFFHLLIKSKYGVFDSFETSSYQNRHFCVTIDCVYTL